MIIILLGLIVLMMIFGAIGRAEAIACQAVTMIDRIGS